MRITHKRSTYWLSLLLIVLLLGLIFFLIHTTTLPQASSLPVGAPTKLTGTTDNTTVTLNWDKPANIKGTIYYRIQRCLLPKGSTTITSSCHFTRINSGAVTQTSYIDTVTAQNAYAYRVFAAIKRPSGYLQGQPSNTIIVASGNTTTITTQPTPPPPVNLADITYYVSPNGSDDNACTSITTACRQITHALDIAKQTWQQANGQKAITISVAASPSSAYNGLSIIGFASQFDPTTQKPMVIQATGPTLITPNGRPGIDIYLENSHGLTFDHITIPATAATNQALKIVQSSYITVSNCIISGTNHDAILTAKVSHATFNNNELHDSILEHGLYLSDTSSDITVSNNLMYNNGGAGLQVNSEKLPGDKSDSMASHLTIENNRIFNNGTQGGAAMNLLGVEDSIIRNNFLINNYAGGITLVWHDDNTSSSIIPAHGPTNNEIVYNTVVMALYKPGTTTPSRYALQVKGASGPNDIRNNVLYQPQGKAIEYDNTSASDALLSTSDFNLFKTGSLVSVYDDQNQALLSDWQKATWTWPNNWPRSHSGQNATHDTNSLFADTLSQAFNTTDTSVYTNPTPEAMRTLTGFIPGDNARLIGKGQATTTKTDSLQHARPDGRQSNPDIGAIEVE